MSNNLERQNFDWLLTQLPEKGDNPYQLIIGKSMWLNGAAKSYGLTNEQAEEVLENASKKNHTGLLYRYDPKTGFKKDIVEIYLIQKY